MNEFPICPMCGKPVNTNSEAHITEADGTVKHHECPAVTPPEEEKMLLLLLNLNLDGPPVEPPESSAKPPETRGMIVNMGTMMGRM